jgi:hypothetical protein
MGIDSAGDDDRGSNLRMHAGVEILAEIHNRPGDRNASTLRHATPPISAALRRRALRVRSAASTMERARYDVSGQTLIIVGLPDRRARGAAHETMWCFQRSLEEALYGSNSSAIHRLYERCALQQVHSRAHARRGPKTHARPLCLLPRSLITSPPRARTGPAASQQTGRRDRTLHAKRAAAMHRPAHQRVSARKSRAHSVRMPRAHASPALWT